MEPTISDIDKSPPGDWEMNTSSADSHLFEIEEDDPDGPGTLRREVHVFHVPPVADTASDVEYLVEITDPLTEQMTHSPVKPFGTRTEALTYAYGYMYTHNPI